MRKFYTIFLAMLFVLALNCTVFAVEITPPNLNPPSYDSYIVFQYSSVGYKCIVYNADDWTPYVDRNTNTLCWIKHRELAYVRYYADVYNYNGVGNNGGWGTLQQYDYMSDSFSNVLKSNKDIYDSENVLFFRALPLEKVIQNNLQKNLQPKVAGGMKILALCGVGLMALLVGLKVFGKVFKIFRVQ